jgi:hypothetical protein
MDASEKFIFTHSKDDNSVYVYRFENQKILRDPYFVYEGIADNETCTEIFYLNRILTEEDFTTSRDIRVVHLLIEEGVNRSLIIGGSGGVKIFSIEGLENGAPLSLEHIVHLKDIGYPRWLCVSDSPAGKFLALGDRNGNTRIWYFNEWETFDYAQEKCQA